MKDVKAIVDIFNSGQPYTMDADPKLARIVEGLYVLTKRYKEICTEAVQVAKHYRELENAKWGDVKQLLNEGLRQYARFQVGEIVVDPIGTPPSRDNGYKHSPLKLMVMVVTPRCRYYGGEFRVWVDYKLAELRKDNGKPFKSFYKGGADIPEKYIEPLHPWPNPAGANFERAEVGPDWLNFKNISPDKD